MSKVSITPCEESRWAAANTAVLHEIELLNMGQHNELSPYAAALYIHHKRVESDYFAP